MDKVISVLKHPVVSLSIGIGVSYAGYQYIVDIQAGHRYNIGEQSDKTYIVTGATSGIGQQLVTDLAMKDAQVIMACRDRNKCLEVRRDIVLKSRNKKVFCRMCDLSDMESVHQFVQKMTKGKYDFKRIDGVILNAATKSKKYDTNPDGMELSLATNHMGHFLLVALLLPKLLAQEGESRIVFVGTDIATKDALQLEIDKLNAAKYTHKFLSPTEKLDPEKGKYDMHGAYKFSKMVETLFARELADRLENSKVKVVAADPGGTSSKLNRNEPGQTFFLTRWSSNGFGYLTGNRRAVRHAVYPILYALVDGEVNNGMFIGSRRRLIGWGANAENAELRKLVWGMSEKWTRLAEHMDRMEREIEMPGYFSRETQESATSDGDKEESRTKKRSARYLWLA